jgi:DNA-binding NtrC family response regulator
MLIVYVDTDATMQERVSETLQTDHRVVTFAELFEAYKWIKHNDVPDVIVTEMDVDASMGLQSLHFLKSKAKLKQTHLIGFTQEPGNFTELVLSEGAAALFAKENLLDHLMSYVHAVSTPKRAAKTLRDVVTVRNGKQALGKTVGKRTAVKE